MSTTIYIYIYIYIYILYISAWQRLIVINHIQNKSFCVHNIYICVCTLNSYYGYINTHTCMYMYIYILVPSPRFNLYILWRVGCLPLIISISPSLNRRPSPGSRREWVCERGGALKTSRSGGVWWGTPEVNGASSPPLLYAECASPRETGLFPVHARWCPRGSRKGALRDRVPHPWDGQADQSRRAPWAKR